MYYYILPIFLFHKMVKKLCPLYIDHEVYLLFKDKYQRTTSQQIEDYMRSIIELDDPQENEVSEAVIDDITNQIEKLEIQKSIISHKLEQEKIKIQEQKIKEEMLKQRCSNCGIEKLPDTRIKWHSVKDGIICHNCFMNGTRSDYQKWGLSD